MMRPDTGNSAPRPDEDWWRTQIEKFRPIVYLSEGEDFGPSSVDWYLKACELGHWDTSQGDLPIWTPDITAPLTEGLLLEPKYDKLEFQLHPTDPDRTYSGEPKSEVPYFVHVKALGGQELPPDVVDIQYWFFYPFNGPLKKVLGAHEGDWENVVVRVRNVRSREPQVDMVYFAAHGSEGNWATRSTSGRAPDPSWYTIDGTRPVVYSAWHTHASYSTLGEHDRGWVPPLPNDTTSKGRRWDGTAELISIDPDLIAGGSTFMEPQWLHWHGRWGGTLPNEIANSPEGPSYGSAWHRPKGEVPGRWSAWDRLARVARPIVDAVPMHLYSKFCSIFFLLDGGGAQWVDEAGDTPVLVGEPKSLHSLCIAGNSRSGLTALAIDKGTGLLQYIDQDVRAISNDRAGWGLVWSPVEDVPPCVVCRAVQDVDGRVHVLVVSAEHRLLDVAEARDGTPGRWEKPVEVLPSPVESIWTTRLSDATPAAVVWTGEVLKFGTLRGETTPRRALSMSATPTWSFPSNVPAGAMPYSLLAGASGRVRVIGLDEQGHVCLCAQRMPYDQSEWDSWQTIGLAPMSGLVAAHEANDSIFVVARGRDGTTYCSRQEAGGNWLPWARFSVAMEAIALSRAPNGRLEAVGYIGGNDQPLWRAEDVPLGTTNDPEYLALVSVASGKVLDVAQGSIYEDGANVQQYAWHNGDNQIWWLARVGVDDYRIVCKESGKVLDVAVGRIHDDGANVQQFIWHGGNNQIWSLVQVGDDEYKVVCKASGKVLDVAANRIYEDGANVQQYAWHGGSNQRWRIVPLAFRTWN